jgi:hypothetical protein
MAPWWPHHAFLVYECACCAANPAEGTAGQPSAMKVAWKRRWTYGSKKSKMCIKGICCCMVFLFLGAIILASLALYFSMSCSKISHFSEVNEYSDIGRAVFVNSTYSRGSMKVGCVPAASSGFGGA